MCVGLVVGKRRKLFVVGSRESCWVSSVVCEERRKKRAATPADGEVYQLLVRQGTQLTRVRYITSCLRYGVNRSIFFSNGGASKVGPLTGSQRWWMARTGLTPCWHGSMMGRHRDAIKKGDETRTTIMFKK